MSEGNPSTASVAAPPRTVRPPSGLPKPSTNLSRSRASSTLSLASVTSERPSNLATSTSGLKRSPSSTEILNPNSFDLKVGDKIYVNGSKPGTIRFIGETSFAPGEWSGIELEEQEGKNDGSVNGVNYFNCAPNYGLFVRPYRLTIEPISTTTVRSSTQISKTESFAVHSTAAGDLIDENALSNSAMQQSINKSNSGGSFMSNLKVGDRVMVNTASGLKSGYLRFISDSVEFAVGKWAGIELDEPTGKNDGSVSGKRYFSCAMNYGLFAPLHKVARESSSSVISKVNTTPVSSRRMTSSLISTRNRGLSGSQESVSSVTSTASVRSTRVRLGVTSLKQHNVNKASNANTVSATANALQEALKEKEDHISQLLKEREMERGEILRAAAKIDELESSLLQIQQEYQRYANEKDDEIQEYKQSFEESAGLQKSLLEQIDDEKRKIEMLEFRLEEEMVTKMELKEYCDRLSEQRIVHKEDDKEMELFQLEEDVLRKEEKILQLEQSLEARKNEVTNLQSRIKEFENQVELFEQRQKKFLETVDEVNLKLKKEQDKNLKMEEERIKKEQLKARLEEQVDDLLKRSQDTMSQLNDIQDTLKGKEITIRKLEDEVKGLREQIAVLTREKKELKEENEKLKFSTEDVTSLKAEMRKKDEDIRKLEIEIKDLLQSSGSNNQHLVKLNDNLREKQDEIRNLQNDLKQLQKTEEKNKKMETKIDEMKVLIRNIEDQLETGKVREIELENRFKITEQELQAKLNERNEERGALEHQISGLINKLGDNNREINALKNTVSQKEEELKRLEDEIKFLKDCQDERDYEGKRTENELQIAKTITIEKQMEMDSLNDKVRELQIEIQSLDDQIRKIKEINEELEIEKETQKREFDYLKKSIDERDELIGRLKSQLESTRSEFKEYRDNLQEEIKSTKNEADHIMNEMQNDIRNAQEDNENLRKANTLLQDKFENLTQEIDLISKRHAEILNEFEEECHRLELKVGEKNNIIENLETKLEGGEKLIEQIEDAHREELEIWKNKVQLEKESLLRKMEELESAINSNNYSLTKTSMSISSKAITTTSTASIESGIVLSNSKDLEDVDDKEQYEQQIEFLNSVIVDMQKKNDELKTKIQILETIGVTDFSDDLIQNKKINGHHLNNHGNHIRAPRLFCDICDLFDLHDTEECPKQMSEMSDIESHSKFGVSRTEDRPYCIHCEIFGHWTDDCAHNQCF